MSDTYGPALPPGFVVSQSDESEKDTTTTLDPQLPESFRAEAPPATTREVYGPALPPAAQTETTSTATHTYGPGLPGAYEKPENEIQGGERRN